MPLHHLCTQVYYKEIRIFVVLVLVRAKVEDRALRHPDAIGHQNRIVEMVLVGLVDLYNRSLLDDLQDVIDVKNEEPKLHGEGRWL